MPDRFSRQKFLGDNSESIMEAAKVAVIGLGGGGPHVFQQLLHLGFYDLAGLDPDSIEFSNLNRLVGGTYRDAELRLPKTSIAARSARRINPDAKAVLIQGKWQENLALLKGMHLIVGCLDSYGARNELEAFCRRYMIPYIDIGMDVTKSGSSFTVSGQVLLSMPSEACMWCMGYLTEALIEREAENYGKAGGRPQVIWPNGVLASLAVGHVVSLLCPWSMTQIPRYLEFNGNSQVVTPSNRLTVIDESRCPHYASTPAVIGDHIWIPEL